MKPLRISLVIAPFAIAWGLTACGGGAPVNGKTVATAAPAQGHATLTDVKLQRLWSNPCDSTQPYNSVDNPCGAQQQLAYYPIVLNAVLLSLGIDATPDTRPPDPGALNVWPDGVTVTTVPDMTLEELTAAVKAEGKTVKGTYPDPLHTGWIHAPDGAVAKLCRSYTSGNHIVVAESLLYEPSATGYEMTNVIMQREGISVNGR